MNPLLQLIEGSANVLSLNKKRKEISCLTLMEEVLSVAASFQANPRNIVIVKDNPYQAQLFYRKLTPLMKAQCVLFEVEESLRVQSISSSLESLAGRVEALVQLQNSQPKICVTHVGALAIHMMNPETFSSRSFSLVKGQQIEIADLKELCQQAGYLYETRVDHPLTYSSRGGILDIFSINYSQPVRIEFFDTEIDSIRFFDPTTQRTVQILDEVTITCANELLLSAEEIELVKERSLQDFEALQRRQPELALVVQDQLALDMDFLGHHLYEAHLYPYFCYLDKTASLLDYIDQPQIIMSQPQKCEGHIYRLNEESVAYLQELTQVGKWLGRYSIYRQPFQDIAHYPCTMIQPFLSVKSVIRQPSLPEEPLDLLADMLHKQAQTHCLILALTSPEIREFTAILEYKGYPFKMHPEYHQTGLYFCEDEFDEGFEFVEDKLIVYTSKEIYRRKRKVGKYINKFNQAEALSSYQDLNPRDYIVHQQHGVGQYMQIITKEIGGVHRDYLQILFKGNDELLVPLEQFSLVRKFVSREGVTPKLNKLGSNEWAKTKAKIKENVNNIAERLIELYSLREENIGFAYSADTLEQSQFENSFEYELTPDQSKAVIEIKEDMMKPKPMDRLLCGDVGFGKTEVALRAAFKAVMDNKQVAFLCPTTILSMQHYKTFKQRLKNYPVNVEVINRFITPSEQTRIISRLKEGKIDILLGTHRLLSKDIQFKDLGFLIIDEEQRFGVEHKEKIKEIKQNVDVLSLSATPIPRTLQMSLIGIRQLSQLDTPPSNRYPVQTYVVEKNKNLIVDVIEKELAREGQVFYLFNNIDQIYHIARSLQADLPDARIAVAHGKMSKEEIEDVMLSFSRAEYNVLICTTIIETGIDIPNANTILVENAHRFGLSQLYQIKGRVGRSDRVAYAYLLVEEYKQLTEIATKRLQSIKEFTELGSGYKIAMRDLTIRGAGDLLGPNQSGFIDAIGIDYYIELLNEAIDERRGIIKEEEKKLEKPQIKVDSYIPHEFAPEDLEKIAMYQKIDGIKTQTQLLEYIEEIKDNHGQFPKSVQLLFEKKQLELLINDENIDEFKETKVAHLVQFSVLFSQNMDGIKLFELIPTISKGISISYKNQKIQVTIPKSKNTLTQTLQVINLAKRCQKTI